MVVVGTDFRTTLDLLDALEEAIAAAGTKGAPLAAAPASPELLRRDMDMIALSPEEFADLFCVPPGAVRTWLSGASPTPSWARAGVRLLCLLAPHARRKVLKRPEPVSEVPGRRMHPFARIEEL